MAFTHEENDDPIFDGPKMTTDKNTSEKIDLIIKEYDNDSMTAARLRDESLKQKAVDTLKGELEKLLKSEREKVKSLIPKERKEVNEYDDYTHGWNGFREKLINLLDKSDE